jgi:hypothetical protein
MMIDEGYHADAHTVVPSSRASCMIIIHLPKNAESPLPDGVSFLA